MTESPLSLVSLSAQLADRAATLAASLDGSVTQPAYLDVVRLANDVGSLGDDILTLCVQQSRDAGHTWQQIGDLLGVTRQAAFQRFGKPIDPRTGEPMDKTVRMTDAGGRAAAVAADIIEGRLESARPLFTEQVATAFTDEVRGSALATVTALVGEFEGIAAAEPVVRRVGDLTVVDVPLNFEAGDMKARVAFDADERVAGFYILAPEAP